MRIFGRHLFTAIITEYVSVLHASVQCVSSVSEELFHHGKQTQRRLRLSQVRILENYFPPFYISLSDCGLLIYNLTERCLWSPKVYAVTLVI